jgi:hypothetical protein
MTQTELQQHLLVLLFQQDELSPRLSPRIVENFSADDWNSVFKMLLQHRLAPLLHWRLMHVLKNFSVPDNLRQKLARHYRTATIKSLAWQSELLRLHTIFSTAGIEYAALKGAYLAFHVYPHPALRPMRDLDILVASDDAMRAYNLLGVCRT